MHTLIPLIFSHLLFSVSASARNCKTAGIAPLTSIRIFAHYIKVGDSPDT